MSRNEPTGRRRAAIALAALAALVASAVAASGASAAGAKGSAVLALANHSKGRTLSGQGVKLEAAAPASLTANQLTVPVNALELGAKPSASLGGGFSFSRGSRTVAVTGARLDVASGALVGSVEGSELPIFRLGGAVSVDAPAGTLSLSEGKLRLTPDAAKLLRRELGLKRALVHRGVGMIWVLAQAERPAAAEPAKPAAPASRAVAVTSGSLDWGVLASWRKYVTTPMGPEAPGTIAVGEGAAASGPLKEASSFVSFPAVGGSYRQGSGPGGERLSLRTQGSVTFAKPGHCIMEVRFSDLEVELAGADSALILDSVYDIDTPPSCADNPPVAGSDVEFARLDLGAVAPTYSADGRTITWSGIPATLTEAGTASFGGNYPPGKELDPLTIAVTTE